MPSKLLRGLGCLAYAVLLFVVFGLAAYTSFSVFVRSGATTVPAVLGLSSTDAANALADQGLARNRRAPADTTTRSPAGRVARQTRTRGPFRQEGDAVIILLFARAARVTVPNLKGKTLPGAQAAIDGTGLALGRILGALAPDHESPGR